MRPSPILLLACFACLTFLASAQTFGSNTSKEYANRTISSAIAVIDAINKSSYLIFQPNLTQAYADLNKSLVVYNVSPAASVVLANKAANEANAQYLLISTYRQESMAVMLLLTALFAYIVIRVMKPVSAKKRRVRKKGRD